MLQHLAKVLVEEIRCADVIGRLGGEEYAFSTRYLLTPITLTSCRIVTPLVALPNKLSIFNNHLNLICPITIEYIS